MNRDERYKYVWRYNQGKRELYDLKNDVHELKNLIDDPGRQSTVDRMRERMRSLIPESVYVMRRPQRDGR